MNILSTLGLQCDTQHQLTLSKYEIWNSKSTNGGKIKLKDKRIRSKAMSL